MKKAVGYLLLFSFLFCAGISFADDISLKVVNNTGKGIKEVLVSEPNTDKWGANLLTAEGLADGASAEVTIACSGAEEYWDLRVLFQDDTSRSWEQQKLKGKTTLTLRIFDEGVFSIKLE
jgi:hypothetical protein